MRQAADQKGGVIAHYPVAQVSRQICRKSAVKLAIQASAEQLAIQCAVSRMFNQKKELQYETNALSRRLQHPYCYIQVL
jgi:hypothetical protein